MNGKTIEVINTDAEGRLILADALCYARELGATKIVDAATLTGACVIALGHAASGVMSNDDAFADRFLDGRRRRRRTLLALAACTTISIRRSRATSPTSRIPADGRAARKRPAHSSRISSPTCRGSTSTSPGTAYLDGASSYMAKGPTGTPVRAFVTLVEDHREERLSGERQSDEHDLAPSRTMMRMPFSTEPGRLEAFRDGVLAVIITIMVLELKPPHGTDLGIAAHDRAHARNAYVLSFVYVGIYWNNHHHMLRAVSGIDGRAMWLNLHLLFWLSLVPFTTSWLGENPTAPFPTVIYGVVLICSAIAFTLLQHSLIVLNGRDTPLAQAVRRDVKGKSSVVLYALAIALAYVSTYISDALFIAVALIWFIPDRRMERVITQVHAEKRA